MARPTRTRLHAILQHRRALLPLITAFVLVPIIWHPPKAAAHETDQYTLPVGREFADLGPYFSGMAYDAVLEAMNITNAAIRRSLDDGRATERTARLQSPGSISTEVWRKLLAAVPTNEIFDANLSKEPFRSRYPGLIVRYAPEQSIYDDPLLLLDITKLVRALFRASTVSVDGKLFGTDKIVHFINLGQIYHSAYLAALKQGLSEKEAIARMLLNTSQDFFLSEDYMLGGATTGIHSNGDLAADYSGFKFYRNLTEAVRIGYKVVPPMLVRDGLYWRLNAHVQRESDFFSVFITPHWNEVLNPNAYGFTSRARLRAIVRSRCADVIDWYRDEHGQRLSQKQFEQIEQELSTFYGEEYGYQSDGKDRVSVANTCFESGQSAAAPGSVAEPGADLRMQNAFGLQPGWGESGGLIKASAVDRSQAAVADRFGRTQLWWAAEDGRLDEVRRLLAQGADPNAGDLDGETALHAAARWGRMDIVQALLAAGADPRVKGLYGITPLQLSVQTGELAVARALLRYKAEVNLRDLFGSSPLHDAVLRGNPDLVALLLEFGADPALADDSGTTPLQMATRGHQDAVVKMLTTPKASARDKDWIGATPCDAPDREGQKHGCPN